MANRLVILDQIEKDMKDKLSSANGYNVTPAEIKRGIYKWNDFQVKPAICFTVFRDEVDTEELAGVNARWLSIMFYGYAETDGAGTTDAIHNLADDMEEFLDSVDFTYTDNTLIGDMEIKEGGVSDPINAFILETRVQYDT